MISDISVRPQSKAGAPLNDYQISAATKLPFNLPGRPAKQRSKSPQLSVSFIWERTLNFACRTRGKDMNNYEES